MTNLNDRPIGGAKLPVLTVLDAALKFGGEIVNGTVNGIGNGIDDGAGDGDGDEDGNDDTSTTVSTGGEKKIFQRAEEEEEWENRGVGESWLAAAAARAYVDDEVSPNQGGDRDPTTTGDSTSTTVAYASFVERRQGSGEDEAAKNGGSGASYVSGFVSEPTEEAGEEEVETPKSDFRRSLDAESVEKNRLRRLERDRIDESRRLLQKSLEFMGSGGAGREQGDSRSSAIVLTLQERTFLKKLLQFEGPGAANACAEAHRRLNDANIFFFTFCGGAAANEMTPGDGWASTSSRGSSLALPVPTPTGSQTETGSEISGKTDSSNHQDWVQDWVLKGISNGQAGDEFAAEATEGKVPVPTKAVAPAAVPIISRDFQRQSLSENRAPLTRQSSDRRLKRLAVRKQQSFSGGDFNRLFRAHEAGLVVTEQGSARRSLMKMGLPIERVFRKPMTAATGEQQEHCVDTEGEGGGKKPASTPRDTPAAVEEDSPELAKMDERTFRKIKREEREKQEQSGTLTPTTSVVQPVGGCVSPFGLSLLQRLYATKQLQFRQSSSYFRDDSFLESLGSEAHSRESSFGSTKHLRANSDGLVAETNLAVDHRDDVFRLSPRPSKPLSEDRLRNLLNNAGFRDQNVSDTDLITDALENDDFSVSVANIVTGGTERWEGEEGVFRGAVVGYGGEGFEVNGLAARKLGEEESSSSLVSSLGSKSLASSSARNNIAGKEGNEDKSNDASARGPRGPSLPTSPEPIRIPAHLSRYYQRATSVGLVNTKASPGIEKPKAQYKRSVSWSANVNMVAQPLRGSPTSSANSGGAGGGGMSVISFPNLRRAAPIRSDSVSSVVSSTVVGIPPLQLGHPLRSESIGSLASFLSSTPPLSRAHPVYSPRSSSVRSSSPTLDRARSLRSLGTIDLGPEDYGEFVSSFEGEDAQGIRGSRSVAWVNPFAPATRGQLPPRGGAAQDPSVLIRQASRNNYEGEGIEVTDGILLSDDVLLVDTLDSARNLKSMMSISDSAISTREYSKMIPVTSLDDSFIIRNINFERHASEILRSLSNEDLCTSHDIVTIGGDTLPSRKNTDFNSIARMYGDTKGDESWEPNNMLSYAATPNVWNFFQDDYADGYNDPLSFRILGTSADDTSCHPHVLSPPLMESLQQFFPPSGAENNFWLKYSLVRDGASLLSLLRHIRGAKHTLIAIETVDGEVFGSFTSSQWRKKRTYYGTGESFLWRMRRTRSDKDPCNSIIDQAKLESELDVFHWSGKNDMVQYCTHNMVAMGGGSLIESQDVPSQASSNPIFLNAENNGGFGLAIDSDLLRGTSSSCATYQNPPLSHVHSDGSPFEIVNCEVWTTTPFSTVEEAEHVEMRKLFLESYDSGSSP